MKQIFASTILALAFQISVPIDPARAACTQDSVRTAGFLGQGATICNNGVEWPDRRGARLIEEKADCRPYSTTEEALQNIAVRMYGMRDFDRAANEHGTTSACLMVYDMMDDIESDIPPTDGN
jgi:hypothetical protein